MTALALKATPFRVNSVLTAADPRPTPAMTRCDGAHDRCANCDDGTEWNAPVEDGDD
jgi:hypothetical protein